MHNAIIAQIKTKPHPNADNIQLGEVCGFQVVVGKETKDGDVGIFFMEGLQLSKEYTEANNLVRKKCPETGKNIGGFFEEKRRVRAQPFRGQKSEGYFAPLSSLKFTGYDISKLKIGDSFDQIGKTPLCSKFITEATRIAGIKSRKNNRCETVMFHRHFETEQLRFNLHKLKPGMLINLTLKMHGTSQRTGYVQVEKPKKWYHRLLGLKPTLIWQYVTGSRNVILEFSGKIDENFRWEAANNFVNKLHKGETVYYEIVGYEDIDRPIMPKVSVTDKEIKKIYGDSVIYNYGCPNGQHAVYVYRITQTNENGYSVDLPWYSVKRRCQEMCVNSVPEFRPTFVFDGGIEYLQAEIEKFVEGPDKICPSHPREGVCVRANDMIFKQKSFTFGVLEGYIKSDDNYIDTEEAA